MTLSRRWLCVLGPVTALALGLHYLRFRGSLIDDAFITFRYAANLRDHLAWGLYPDQLVNTATSPLNVGLLALFGLPFRDMPDAAIALAATESLILLAALYFLFRRLFGRPWLGVLAGGAIITNPLILSAIGLESLLHAAIMMVCLLCFAVRRPVALGVSGALLTLTRPDGILLPIVLLALYRTESKSTIWAHRGKIVAALLAILGPWCLFSWLVLGGVLPDTLLIKAAQRSWGPWSFSNGIGLYFEAYPIAAAASFIGILSGLAAIASRRVRDNPVAVALICYALLYYCGYSLLNVPPYHWYYSPLIVSLTVLGAVGLAMLPTQRVATALLGLVCAVGLVVTLSAPGGLVPSQVPIHTNWATAQQYRDMAEWLNANLSADDVLLFKGEIGTLAYYAQPRFANEFSCREEQTTMREALLKSGGILQSVLRANSAHAGSIPFCGPYSYSLFGYDRAPSDVLTDTSVMKSWSCSSTWTPNSLFVLKAN